MDKWLQAKKKHHYVWQHYLKSWAIDGKVYWVSPKGNISWDSPKGMCVDKGLYKINPLEKEDIEYIRKWSSNCTKYLQNRHREILMPFVQISNLIRICSAGLDDYEDLKQIEEALRYNSLEDLYCCVEEGAKPAIEGLAKGDASVLENNSSLIGLYSYLGHQITRTLGLKERFFELSEKRIPLSSTRDVATRLAEKNWWFLCYMLGDNLGSSLYCSRHEEKLILVENNTDVSFITGDSPVVNIHPDNDDVPKGTPPDSLDIYFPVSPRYGVIICSSTKWNFLSTSVNMDDAKELNSRLAHNSRYSIYGISKEVIKLHKNEIKQW